MNKIAVLSLFLSASLAYADHHKTGEKTKSGDRKSADAGQTQDFDGSLAEALAFGNQAEIAVSEFAAENVTNPMVKDFAQQMVKAHTKTLEKLKAFAPEVTDIRELDIPSTRDTQEGQPSMERIWTEAAARCLKMTKEDMQKYSGLDLDWAYVNQQKAAHTKMLSELQAMQGVGSDRFNEIVSASITHTEEHLERLNTLVTTLERAEQR